MSAPVEVPDDIIERIRTLCLALPEVTVRVDGSPTRASSAALSFDIRRRSFGLLVAWEDSTGKAVPLLVLRADPDEREALLPTGHPFFASRAGRDRIVVVLTDDCRIGPHLVETAPLARRQRRASTRSRPT